MLRSQDMTLCEIYGVNDFSGIGTDEYSVTLASTLPSSTFTNDNLYIQGTLVLDVNTTFTNCTVKMGPGAWIYTQGTVALVIDASRFFACNKMWRGISIFGKGSANVQSSAFEDAQYCFSFSAIPTVATFIRNTFNRNYVGIRVTGIPILTQNIFGNVFNCTLNLNAPYPGQSPSPGAVSLCGIELTNASLIVGNATLPQGPNFFLRMRGGIFSDHAQLTVWNGFFLSMRSINTGGNEFQGLPSGSGIIARNGAVSVNGGPPEPVGYCTFSSNEQDGIYAEDADLSVWHSLFSENIAGIRSLGNNAAEVIDIEECDFNSLGRSAQFSLQVWGVFLDQSNSLLFNRLDNNQFTTSSNPVAQVTVYGMQINGDPAGQGCSVSGNSFENFAGTPVEFIRIQANAADNFIVEENDIRFHQVSGLDNRWGIAMFTGSGVNHRIWNNEIYGDAGNFTNNYTCGFHINRVPNIEMCINATDIGRRGFHFIENSNPMEFGSNIIGSHFNGLEIASGGTSGEIGDQIRTANEWSVATGAYGNLAAWNNSLTWTNSEFVAHDPNPIFIPSIALREPDLLFTIQAGDPEGCAQKAEVQKLSTFDEQVADGTYQTFSEMETWEAQRRVYYKLLRFPELAEEVADFYAQIDEQSAGRFARVDFEFRQAMEPSGVVQTALVENLVALAETEAALLALSAELEAAPTEALWDHQEALAAEWTALMQTREALRAEIIAGRHEALEALAPLLAGLPQTTSYEQARVQYLQWAIQKAKDESFSEAEIADIHALIESDAAQTGYAAAEVALLLPLGDPLANGLPFDCGAGTGERDAHLHGEDLIGKNFLFPNPTANSVQLDASALKQKGVLSISNLLGRQVMAVPVENNPRLDVSKLENGVYWCVLETLKGVAFRQKLVIFR